jgi:hypothetical protein
MDPMPPDHDDADDIDRGHNVGDPALGRTRLLSRQCTTCIFKPGNPMHLGEGRLHELVTAALDSDSYIVCHSTLPYHAPAPDTGPAICRGFADQYSTNALRMIERLWGFVEVDPPGERPDTTPADPEGQPPNNGRHHRAR